MKNAVKFMAWISIITTMGCIPLGIDAEAAPKIPEYLMFQTGFDDISFSPPSLSKEFEWQQKMLVLNKNGTKSNVLGGTSWYHVSGNLKLDEYIETKIDTVPGHDGKPTNAYLMKTLNYDPTSRSRGGLTRQEYALYPWKYLPEINEIYIKYWIKIQDDLPALMPEGKHSWRMLMEWMERPNGPAIYRWNLMILRNPKKSKDLFFRLHAQKGTGDRDPVDWEEYSFDKRVPIGEWFLLEMYHRQSEGGDGRIWVAINGQTLFDHKGRNRLGNAPNAYNIFSPFKSYTGEESLDRGPAYQWIDDFKFYSNAPRP